MNKHFNKNLIRSEDKEEQYQSSNTCWVCKKPSESDDEKVRDHCHITRKFRGAAHWSCNINLQLNKIFPIMFHNLRRYDSYLIFDEGKHFYVKIDVTPNRLEKYMAFILNKNLVFTGTIQFINSSLEKLVKNLPDNLFQKNWNS